MKSTAALLRSMHAELFQIYGPQGWWPAESPLEVIVGAYLTQSTAWRAVEKSIDNLRARAVLSVEGLREIPEEELRELIKPSGFMRRKAASIKAFIHFLDREYAGSLARLAAQNATQAREQLLSLPGVGQETADAILLYALGQPIMVVDEYLRRLVTRHGLMHERASYSEMQKLAHDAFVDDDAASCAQHFNEFHALVVELGKQHCRRQAQCDGCPLSKAAFHPPLPSTETMQEKQEARK
jgi:endonuclease-3 related protein